MELSVIIPTYNRKNILKKCLNALFGQTYPGFEFEIIVIDDGSTDGTESIVKEIMEKSPVGLKYFKQENKGPAAARNAGIKNANGKIILFIGDDIISSPTLIEEHIKYHKQYLDEKIAVLGYVTWSKDIKITSFTEWLGESGAQFGYSLINDPENVSYRFFYTSNVSVKREFLLKHGLFDEDFPYAAMEDIELAYRLTGKGFKIVYNSMAVGYHEHIIDQSSFVKRSELVGRAMAIFHQMHPELKEENKDFARFNLLAIIKIAIWHLPLFMEKFIPKRFLVASYSYMVLSYMKKGYYQ